MLLPHKKYGITDLFLYRETDMFKIAKGYDHITKTIRIPEPMAAELESLAEENDLSLNQLVVQCIQFALEHISPDEDAK